jgi:hypothetical protein
VRKDEGHVFLSMEFESFDMKPTQGEVNHTDGQVPKPSVLDDLLGVSSTSMDVDPSSVNDSTHGETECLGTGTPKDRDEVNKREVCEYDG